MDQKADHKIVAILGSFHKDPMKDLRIVKSYYLQCRQRNKY